MTLEAFLLANIRAQFGAGDPIQDEWDLNRAIERWTAQYEKEHPTPPPAPTGPYACCR